MAIAVCTLLTPGSSAAQVSPIKNTISTKASIGNIGNIGNIGHVGNIGNITIPACSTPTVSQCLDRAFLDSFCGGLAQRPGTDGLSSCERAVANEADARTAGYAADGSGRRLPSDYSRIAHEGSDATYASLEQLQRLAARNPAYRAQFDRTIAGFTSDGGAIKSCQEYVYQRNWDYERFRYDGERLGDDRMAVARLALDRGILTRELRTYDGTRAPQLGWVARSRAKNGIFGAGLPDLTYTPDLGRGRAEPAYELADEEIGRKMAARPRGYAGDLAWHSSMVRALSSYTNEQLSRANEVVRRYEQLVREVRGLDRELTQRLGGVCGGGLPGGIAEIECFRSGRMSRAVALHNERAQQLYEQLEQTLIEADGMGCLEATGASVCDWQPELLVEQLGAVVEPAMEREFLDCIAFTSDDFGPRSRIRTFEGRDWTRRTSELEAFMTRTRSVIADVARFVVSDGDGARVLGETYSDFTLIGSPSAGAVLDYSFGWELSDMAAGRSLCELDAAIRATFRAGTNFDPTAAATGTGPRFSDDESANIIDFNGRVSTESDSPNLVLEHDLSVAGIDIYRDLETQIPIEFTLVNEHTSVGTRDVDVRDEPEGRGRSNEGFGIYKEGKLIEIRGFVVVLGFLRVNLAAGVGGEIGVKFKLKAGAKRNPDCTMGDPMFLIRAGVEVEPYTGVEGFAEVSLDAAGIIGVGLRAELTLVGASLPFNAGFSIGPSQRGEAIDLSAVVDADLRFKLKLLDGEVKLLVTSFLDNILPGLPVSVSLFSWDGIVFEEPIFTTRERVFDLEIARLAL